MGEIVNLRRVRKAKARTEAACRAEANRITFGRTRAEREATEAEKLIEARRLDAHKLEKPGEQP